MPSHFAFYYLDDDSRAFGSLSNYGVVMQSRHACYGSSPYETRKVCDQIPVAGVTVSLMTMYHGIQGSSRDPNITGGHMLGIQCSTFNVQSIITLTMPSLLAEISSNHKPYLRFCNARLTKNSSLRPLLHPQHPCSKASIQSLLRSTAIWVSRCHARE